MDRAIASLKSLMNDLNEQIRSLEIQIPALKKKSQRAVEMKNRSSALAALRSKRTAESALSRRTDALFQLEEVYGKIEQASDQITMLRVMRDSTEVLHNLNAKASSVEDVEDLLVDFKEEMGKAEDIGTAINQVGQEASAINEDEVDEELEALIRQSQSAEDEKAVEETKRRLADVHFADVSNSNGTSRSMPSDGRTSATPAIGSDPSVPKEATAPRPMSLDKGATLSGTSRHSHGHERDNMAALVT